MNVVGSSISSRESYLGGRLMQRQTFDLSFFLQMTKGKSKEENRYVLKINQHHTR